MITRVLVGLLFQPALSAPAAAAEPRWDFSADAVGRLPVGWAAHGGSPEGVYRVESEPGGNRYLAALSRRSDVQIGLEVGVKTEQYPVLSWRWRVWELPSGADEHRTEAMDSAAAVYVVFGSRLLPRVIKYVWSSSLAPGTVIRHPRYRSMATVVVASGAADLGVWQRVARNVVQDARAIFDVRIGVVRALGVKTDSDSTGGSARADYDDLAFEPGLPMPPASAVGVR